MSRLTKNEKAIHDLHAFNAVEKLLRDNKGQGALHGAFIANQCGLKNDVEVRYCVNYLRSICIPICSNTNGYWIANTDEEILDTVKMLKARAYSMLSIAYRMQTSLIDQDEMDLDAWLS